MKLQYLGTAAAEAIPAVFCVCRTCRDAREKGGRNIRTRSQAIVNDSLLIDYPCDAYIHSIQNGIDYSGIHHCLITHIHADHLYSSDFEYLRSGFCKLPEDYEGFHLYGSVDVEAKVAKIAERTNGKLVFHCIKPFEPFFIGEMKVTALRATHGTPNPYIYLIEENGTALLYAHDTDIFPEETWDYLRKCGVTLRAASLDCTGGVHEDLEYTGHMCVGRNQKCRQQMLESGIADQNTTFILNHFSHNGLSVGYDEFCSLVKPLGFEISYDGMTVNI